MKCFFLAITSSKFYQITTAIFKNIGLVLTKNNLFKMQSNLMHSVLVSGFFIEVVLEVEIEVEIEVKKSQNLLPSPIG